MCYYIGIEDLAANALIECKKKNKHFISFVKPCHKRVSSKRLVKGKL